MEISTLDWIIIGSFFATTLGIGFAVSRRAGKNPQEFFLSGRSMPWWLLGVSMVATTFSTDTPNLVTDIVRQNGVAGNWVWWAFLLTGLLTVFVYARLWRKSGLTTDIEFYEIRYSGAPARFLRGLRAIYLGLFFNMLAMAGVCLAAIKIGEVMMGWDAWQTIGLGTLITVVFSSLGGFRGVIYTDFLLFFLAMTGSIGAAIVAINHPDVGGLESLLANESIQGKLSLLPDFSQPEAAISIFIIPLAVQWWNAWYPGAEPGGGGYVAQRMLAAKDESHAIRATFFFNIAHYALRPWPWILVALASLVVFPSIADLQAAFPHIDPSKVKHDLAYPAMLTFLPQGLLGIVLASLMAAFMSTISTHLNWGASYLVHDFYKRFVRKEAEDREMVLAGRLTTVLLMTCAALFALLLENAKQVFDIMLMFGAGTGLIFILRWFWWRINAWSEIVAMFSSGIISILFSFSSIYPESLPDWGKFPMIVGMTTILWAMATILTPPEDEKILASFVKRIRPGGPGWKRISDSMKIDQIGDETEQATEAWKVPKGILAMFVGAILIYSSLFATGYWIYGKWQAAFLTTLLAIGSGIALGRIWNRDLV